MDIDLQLVLVEWLDANTDNEGVTEDTVMLHHKPWIIHTLGWLLYEDESGITLVTEYYDNYYRGRSFIPKGMIKTITPYKLSQPRKPKTAPKSIPSSSALEIL
jgi:hypothetical protein